MSLVALEKHFIPPELAELWGFSPAKIRLLFAQEPGVLRAGEPSRRAGRTLKRGYHSIRIPETVVRRVLRIDTPLTKFPLRSTRPHLPGSGNTEAVLFFCSATEPQQCPGPWRAAFPLRYGSLLPTTGCQRISLFPPFCHRECRAILGISNRCSSSLLSANSLQDGEHKV